VIIADQLEQLNKSVVFINIVLAKCCERTRIDEGVVDVHKSVDVEVADERMKDKEERR